MTNNQKVKLNAHTWRFLGI